MTDRSSLRSVALLPLLLLPACRSSEGPSAPEGSEGPQPAPAIVLAGSAYDTAIAVVLPPEAPEEYDGLHNVFRLSENVISGSEPDGGAGLRQIRDMGVRTILSVDGKIPDAAGAAALGMRYVHVPIQYKGVTDEELAEIAKTFRELEGPFYVHCFHGKHRGPAAAAIGRIVLDGTDRQTAIAEMRQYCGTSSKYEGLYRDIATAYIPSVAETRGLAFDFHAQELPRGVVGAMVGISRANDELDLLEVRAFAADPEHPDVDALNAAERILQSFAAALTLDEVANGPADFRAWFQASHDDGVRLVDALRRARAGEAGAAEQASAAWSSVKASCTECHSIYRN